MISLVPSPLSANEMRVFRSYGEKEVQLSPPFLVNLICFAMSECFHILAELGLKGFRYLN
jgi:hypothetical protein